MEIGQLYKYYMKICPQGEPSSALFDENFFKRMRAQKPSSIYIFSDPCTGFIYITAACLVIRTISLADKLYQKRSHLCIGIAYFTEISSGLSLSLKRCIYWHVINAKMVIAGQASRLMLKIESFVTTLASIDCAIRWSNLFSMDSLSDLVFAGLIALQSLATLLLLVGVGMTIWELWTTRNMRRFWDPELGEMHQDRYYILCEIPVHKRRRTPSLASSQDSTVRSTVQEDEPTSAIQIRAKREIWFTASAAFIDDFLVPCIYYILFQNDCAAYRAAGGNNWFDIAEATVGTLAALFVWIIVGSLLLRVASMLRKGECAAKCPKPLRWIFCIMVGALGMVAIGFSLCSGAGLGLFMSTQCPQQNANETTLAP